MGSHGAERGHSLFTLFTLVLALVITAGESGCSKTSPSESTTKASKGLLKITAPEKARQIWREWNGRYVIFVHRENPVHQLADFSNRSVICAMINTEAIVGDVQKLLDAGEVKGYGLGIQNNPEVYDKDFLREHDAIAVLLPAVAEHYGFRNNPELVEVVIE